MSVTVDNINENSSIVIKDHPKITLKLLNAINFNCDNDSVGVPCPIMAGSLTIKRVDICSIPHSSIWSHHMILFFSSEISSY